MPKSRSLSFNDAAELYDKVRPGYPRQAYLDLRSSLDLSRQSTVLEVGCGTGQATNRSVNSGVELIQTP